MATKKNTVFLLLALCNVYQMVPSVEAQTKLVVKGCRELNYCWGHGFCVSRGIGSPVSTCQCNDGWGSPFDIAESPAVDCSSRTCPTGPAWGDITIAKPKNASDSLVTSRMVKECSGAGRCDRLYGECKCFGGFTGRACERRACYGEPLNTCSGNGMCLSLKQLSRMSDALPLSNSTYVYGPSASNSDYWDEGRSYSCHCDSSWKVGLGPGETQEPEFFGNGCQMKRCPTGDDPQTPYDDTDCTNVTAAGGHGVGEPGNKCHVDCSNRGKCNFNRGLCQCYKGYSGTNCGSKV